MTTTIGSYTKALQVQEQQAIPAWQRILLLVMLGYEAAGCLLGGTLLIVKPDGSLMDMPVDIMHGFFTNFLIPGVILFGLGILNLFAFISVLRRTANDWVMAGLALGGLFTWFVIEIIILRELHWLHLMWGFPVFLGLVLIIPLIVSKQVTVMTQNVLLTCGIISSLWYVAINIFVPMMWSEYSVVTQTVSELSATGAPTRILWVLLCLPYPLLFAAFGGGVLRSSARNRSLRIMGIIIVMYAILNFYWPPMHLREVIAAGGGTLSDTLHIVWVMIILLLMMLIMGFGAAASGKGFRRYTIVSFVAFIVFGALIGMESPGIQKGLPTPMIGVWERINIGVFMLWVIVFALSLIRKDVQSK